MYVNVICKIFGEKKEKNLMDICVILDEETCV